MKSRIKFLCLNALLIGSALQAMDVSDTWSFVPPSAFSQPLHIVSSIEGAVSRGNLEEVKSLIAQAQDKNRSINDALFYAARDGEQDVVMFLLNTYPYASNPKGLSTLLASATGNGHLNLVKLALEKGANIEGTEDEVSTTPLRRAVVGGHAQIAKYLIEQGANTNMLRSYRSQLPLLSLIAMGDYYATMRVILTTIPLSEAQRIKAAVASIRFGTPFPRDIRNLMTLKLIRQFVQEHMVYAQKLLDDVEANGTYMSRRMKQAIADLREPAQWNAIRQEVETNFRQILARPLQHVAVPQQTPERQDAVNEFLNPIESSGEKKSADTDNETDYDELYG